MKRIINSNIDNIYVLMYLQPIFYEDSEIFSAVSFNRKTGRYITDINPDRVINGPLSGPGEELESPIKDEWEAFIDDCKFLVNEVGFTIIESYRSIESKKSEYVIMFGIDDTPCGSIIYDLRISDHPFPVTFPEEAKDKALEYLTMEKILDGSATKAGIDFKVIGVIVGGVKKDSWNRSINRLYNLLVRTRNKLQIRIKKS